MLIFSYGQNAFSQNDQWEFSITGGYSLPTGILRLHDSLDSSSKLRGYNIGLSTGYYFTERKDISLTASLSFDHLYSLFTHQDYYYNYGTTLNIISLNLGMNYKFLNTGKLHPFLGLEVSGNYYNGKTVSTYLYYDPKSNIYSYNLLSTFRAGLQIGGGIEFDLNKNFGLIAGYKFNFSNLIGRSNYWEPMYEEYGLMDDYYSDDIHGLDIFYSQFYTGITFYPGRVLKQ